MRHAPGSARLCPAPYSPRSGQQAGVFSRLHHTSFSVPALGFSLTCAQNAPGSRPQSAVARPPVRQVAPRQAAAAVPDAVEDSLYLTQVPNDDNEADHWDDFRTVQASAGVKGPTAAPGISGVTAALPTVDAQALKDKALRATLGGDGNSAFLLMVDTAAKEQKARWDLAQRRLEAHRLRQIASALAEKYAEDYMNQAITSISQEAERRLRQERKAAHAAEFCARGDEDMSAGAMEAAVKNYRSSIQHNAINPKAFYGLGKATFNLVPSNNPVEQHKRLQKCITSFKEAVMLEDMPQGWFGMACAHVEMGDLESARHEFEEGLRGADEHEIEGFLSHASVCHDLGDHTSAVKSMQRVHMVIRQLQQKATQELMNAIFDAERELTPAVSSAAAIEESVTVCGGGGDDRGTSCGLKVTHLIDGGNIRSNYGFDEHVRCAWLHMTLGASTAAPPFILRVIYDSRDDMEIHADVRRSLRDVDQMTSLAAKGRKKAPAASMLRALHHFEGHANDIQALSDQFDESCVLHSLPSTPCLFTVYEGGSEITLQQLILRRRRARNNAPPFFSPVEVLVVLRSVASALADLHSQGYVHRAVLPSNILLGGPHLTSAADSELNANLPVLEPPMPCVVKLTQYEHSTDVGRLLQPSRVDAKDVLRLADPSCKWHFAGSRAFVGPEIHQAFQSENVGSEHLDVSKCDVFSLGVIAFCMISMEAPFNVEVENLLSSGIHDDHSEENHARQLPECYAEEFQDFVHSLLNPIAKRRPSAADLVDICRDLLTDAPPSVMHVSMAAFEAPSSMPQRGDGVTGGVPMIVRSELQHIPLPEEVRQERELRRLQDIEEIKRHAIRQQAETEKHNRKVDLLEDALDDVLQSLRLTTMITRV